MATVDFNFRAKEKGGYKRPTLSLEVNLPNAEDVANALVSDNPKVSNLIIDAIQSIVIDHIKNYVNDNMDFTQETLDAMVKSGQCSLEYIANIPKADRNVLSKEDLVQFAEDYTAIMPGVTGKDVSRIKAAASLYIERFKRAAGDNPVLQILQAQLEVFVEAASEEVISRNDRVITWARNKLQELLDAKVTADAL